MSNDAKIHEKLDRLDSRLDKVDLRLEKYNSELEYHIEQTNILKAEIVPLIKSHEQWKGAGKLIMWSSLVATIVGGMAWLWTK